MTQLMESARKALRRQTPLDGRVDGLASAVAACRGRIDTPSGDPAVERALSDAETVVQRAGQRLKLSADHTVVALAGATGSGKSSMFNALTGHEFAAVGVRRPTTSATTACVWGEDDSGGLLDWLEIPPRHRVSRDSVIATESDRRDNRTMHGLVLLDLPDHDSTEVAHHLEAERLVGLADLMVWVLDPQKYADAAIHRRFLAPMAGHRDVMLVVLNHVDELPAEERPAVLDDVRRLLRADGLDKVQVLATSATTGEGIEELRKAIGKRVADKAATRARLSSDVTAVVQGLTSVLGVDRPPTLGSQEQGEVVDSLCDAAGVPVVVDAVRRATSARARRATGWPVTAWLSRLRPDPLRRLHLNLGRSGNDLVSSARSSLPPTSQVQRARVESSIRALTNRLGEDLSPPWGRALRAAATSRAADLDDRLDRVVTGTDLGADRTPLWCEGVRVLQWVLLVTALVGVLWLGTLAVLGYARMPQPTPPDQWGFPLPTLLLVVGVLAGVLLALLSRSLIALGSRSRARRAERRLRAGVREVAAELVVAPVEEVLADCRTAVDGLKRARG